jgi:LuxR family maltose regulon positive regulatory protein
LWCVWCCGRISNVADPADVAFVCASAGYGKTLLLADWARSSTGADAAWVGLDRDDNDARRLWASVFRCVVRSDP